MTTDLERRLHDELAGLAATTTTAPDALERIVERAGRARRRRRVPLLVATAAAAVLVVVAVAVARRPDDGARVTAELPPAPPALVGTVTAAVLTNPCVGNCVAAAARFDVADPEDLELLGRDGRWTTEPEFGREGPDALPDGRHLVVDDGGVTVVVDPATGDELFVGKVTVQSADLLADGRVVMVAIDRATDLYRVGVVDPDGGGLVDLPIPDGLQPHAVAAGPGGSFAVLADRESCCLNEPALLVVDRDGTEHVHDLSDALDGRRNLVVGEPELSWGASGLLAVSQDLAEPYIPSSPQRGWVVVVDPATGDRVAAIDGWQGVAWSPDGHGLLLARHLRPRSSEVAVFWGPGLAERIDLGVAPLPVLPRSWAP
ncbi:MAG TPA: hypothetical protein VGB14_14065 [Acidimicrobiales bacterium]|jgi:hypothetical protein